MELEAYSDEPTPQRVAWRSLLIWLAVVTTALLILELTAQPALSIPLLCSKFGWSDFATASWLWRVDPCRRRGRVHCGLFMAAGVLKTALAAGIVMLPLGLWLAEQPAPAQQGIMGQRLFWVLVTFAGAFIVAGFLALGTFLAALRWHVKVWLEPTVHRARRENAWPTPYCRQNRAGTMFLAALLAMFFLLSVIGASIIAAANNRARFMNQDVALVVAVFCVVVVVPILSLTLNDVIRRRVVARTPDDCWETA